MRKLVHEYKSAAAFQRQRLRGVIAHYRGLHLVVQAHAVFAADLSLTLPDGTTLDAVTAATDAGVWQSVGHTVSEIPATLRRLRGRITQAVERIATIDSELARLEQWDGQQSYDAAASELSAINAVFAAEEERASAEWSATPVEGTAPVEEVASGEELLSDVLLALAMQDRASGEWDDQPSVIPPAPESLAHLAAELERREITSAPPVSQHEDERAEGQLDAPTSVGLYRVQGKAKMRFGDHATPKRGARAPAPPEQTGEDVLEQLSLF